MLPNDSTIHCSAIAALSDEDRPRLMGRRCGNLRARPESETTALKAGA
jgi:hypothetical protein